MASGSNVFYPISATSWVGLTEEDEIVSDRQLAMVAKCIGTPPTAADGSLFINTFEHGCLMTQTDTGTGNAAVYENTGSRAVPVWTLFGSGAGVTGYTGFTGMTGYTGYTGYTGTAGSATNTGATGYT